MQDSDTRKLKQPSGTPSAPPFLVAENLTKSFGGAVALRDVALEIRAGEVHGLVGANGAGKSTFIKILAGLIQPDTGTVKVDGLGTGAISPQKATDLGLSFIHQELAFVPGMTVLQNIMLGVPKATRFGLVDWKAVARDVRPIADRVGIKVSLDQTVRRLSTSEIWQISICRALVRNARLIVMDEPTASLSAAESARLFEIIRDLSDQGVAVLYVSHRLDEITQLCDRATVLRDGELVAEIEKADLTRKSLVRAIVGAELAAQDHLEHTKKFEGPPMLRLQGLTRDPTVQGVDLELHPGEVLGIGGLVGAGRSELARLIFGADKIDAGTIELDGKDFAPKSPGEAVRAGVGYVPEERRRDGLLLSKGIAFNLSLANLEKVSISPALPLVSSRKRRSLAEDTIRALAIKAEGPAQHVGKLSGGNQQKVVIGRWLARRPQVLILDEPTRGVDVGARAEIHRLIRELAADGMAVIAISSEPDELPDLCDRVLVMSEGRIVEELTGSAITRAGIVAASYAEEQGALSA